MTRRERILAMTAILLVLLVGGGALFGLLFVGPMMTLRANIADKKREIANKEKKIQDGLVERKKLDKLKPLSLPANPTDPTLGQREYEKYLSDLLVQSKFAPGAFSVTPRQADVKTVPTLPSAKPGGKKEPIYTRLIFLVQARGELDNLIEVLEKFYKTPLLHQVRNLTIQRPIAMIGPQGRSRERELEFNFAVEALILDKAEKRTTLVSTTPVERKVLADPPRKYQSIAAKDIFHGLPPQEKTSEPPKDSVRVAKYVYLTDITKTDIRTEAFLYNRYTGKKTRLRTTSGFNKFQVTDSFGEVQVKGEAVRIDGRDMVFKVDEKYYVVHVGDNIYDAMRKPLKAEQLKDLGLDKLAADMKPADE